MITWFIVLGMRWMRRRMRLLLLLGMMVFGLIGSSAVGSVVAVGWLQSFALLGIVGHCAVGCD